MHELRLAFRRLAHQRGFALVAILTLAVGIGANTAIFSLVDSVLLRPLAFVHPQQLVVLDQSIPQFVNKYPYVPTDADSYHQWQLHSKLISAIGLLQPEDWVLSGAGQPRQVYGAEISATLFPMLGVEPSLGRNFTAAEDQPGANHEILLSAAFWRTEFHSNPAVIGTTVDLNGSPNTIVGVLPASLAMPHGSELGPFLGAVDHPMQIFRPAGINFAQAPSWGNFNNFVVARLKPGVSVGQLRAECNVIEANLLAASHAPAHLRINTVVTPLRDVIVGNHGLGLWLLLAAVGAILLIVCLNLANLLLVRVHGRGHELAIRVALGAGRGRLVMETVLEGLALAALGGLIGIVAAWAALRALVHAAPAGIPRLAEVGLNPVALGFAIALALLCGVLFSLWPALRSAHADPQLALRAGGRGTSDSVRGLRTRSWLVGAQAGLAALLLIVAGLLVASYMDLLGVHKGFLENQTVVAGLDFPAKTQPQLAFYRDVLGRVASLPGVQAAGLIDTLPTQGANNVSLMSFPHDTRPVVDQPLSIYSGVSAGYFAAAGIPLLRGRTFTAQEMAAAAQQADAPDAKAATLPPLAALVSASTAARIWPHHNPMGQEFTRGGGQLFQVVGVVGNVRTEGLAETPGLQAYVPYTDLDPGEAALLLHTTVPLTALAPRLRAAVWSVQPEAAITHIGTMADVVATSVAGRRFQMLLVIAFALCALFLAALGIYGVIAYSIERRTGEIGIRVTMGAGSGDLVGMVLRQGLTPVVAGIVAGAIAAVLLGRVLASLLFGVHAADPTVILAVALLLLAAGAAACAGPARRATRISPLSVVRN
ncbi:MAG: ADOP family duplicated permease [Terriglobales bacterium]